jgi:stringent starvation protein B|tara:strand:+ start:1733 stop:2107 length:375 start_codon:yes stop_codon:yes gene_type:complete
MTMTSSVPYLLRALYDWILDNRCTPYLVINALNRETSVPQDFVKDGQIVLNISPSAIRDLELGDDSIQFNGRFAGIRHEIHAPMAAVMAIYAKENGQGMWFPKGETEPEPPADKKGGPHLKVIK